MASLMVENGLKGLHIQMAILGSTSSAATADDTGYPYLSDLTTKIRWELHVDFDENLNKNNAMLLKNLGEANLGLNIDIGDYCPIILSDDDENATSDYKKVLH